MNLITTSQQLIEAKLVTPNFHFSNYLSEPVEKTLAFRAIHKPGVTLIVNSLDSRKAFGPASIPNNLLKLLKNEISKRISLLANTPLIRWYFLTFSKQQI